MASIFKRKNKDGTTVWRAVVRIKGHPTVCFHDERKKVVEDLAADAEREIRHGKHYTQRKNSQKKTLADLIDRYIDDGVLERHKAAKDTERQLVYFRKQIGSYALTYINPELLIKERKKLQNSLTEKGTARNPSTINRYFATLGGAFRYACKNLRWLDENPCHNLIPLKTKPKTRRVLTEREEIRLLEACKTSTSPYLFCIVLMGITTGARKSEILNLTWNDIDFENRVAHFSDTKNNKPRTVALVDSVVAELRSLYHSRHPKKALVFASKTAFGQIDIKRSWQSALKKANIDNFVFHCLRHHYCTFGGKIGASSAQLRSQLGHSTARMTDHYSHLDADATRFIAEKIEQRINLGASYDHI